MWKLVAKKTCSRKAKLFPAYYSALNSLNISQCKHFFAESSSPEMQTRVNFSCPVPGQQFSRKHGMIMFDFLCSINSSSFSGLGIDCQAYSRVAEAIASSEAVEHCVEVKDSVGPINKTERGDDVKPKKTVRGMTEMKYALLRRRQVKIETEAWNEAAKEYQELIAEMCEQKLAPNLPYIKSLFLGWFEPLRNAIAAEQKLCAEGKDNKSYGPYIIQLPADKMAVITMHKLMGLLMTVGDGVVRLVLAACRLGEAIEHEVRIHEFLEKSKKKTAKNKSSDQSNFTSKGQDKLRMKVTGLMKKQKVHQVRAIVKAQDDSKSWGQAIHAKVGCCLIQLLMDTAYIQHPTDDISDCPEFRPAFMHAIKMVASEARTGTQRYGVIQCDPLIRRGLEKTAKHVVIPYMPMLVPPLYWTGYEKGAYLFLPSYIMRTRRGTKKQRAAFKGAPKEQLKPIFEALNALGNTKWRVNQRVLGIIDWLWTSGCCSAGLVGREDLPLPLAPDTDDDAEIRKWKWKLKGVRKVNSERHSLRCDTELKLAVARKMKGEDGFFYPHNLDFRGRAYPMHPHLNHLGCDLCRGILEFAEGRPLGKSGLHWLKIHLANLYAGGVEKLSYEGRIAFTENHLDDVFDSADDPLEGRQWWLNAEDPFQCLAACMNLAEALRSSSPEATISHLPVHMDGSCNGLQHYAALGRDKLGAVSVNLVAGEKPADVYSRIAMRVLDMMRKDAEDPATSPNALYAELLIDQVDRKLVKQTVMTSVYGVTSVGARDQIKQRLRERDVIDDDDKLFGASCYAAKTTLAALEQMFEGARGIMNWLGQCAKIVSTENQPVKWTTPLGLPVVQPYQKLGRFNVKTSLQILSLKRETDKVMGGQQKTAFPPNFVHSLDGCHMMMTAVACRKAGLHFAGVHDSYWTHACDVDEMNHILREKFVQLYEAPVLENLLKSFQSTFPKLNFPPTPQPGDLDLRAVLESPYFFN